MLMQFVPPPLLSQLSLVFPKLLSFFLSFFLWFLWFLFSFFFFSFFLSSLPMLLPFLFDKRNAFKSNYKVSFIKAETKLPFAKWLFDNFWIFFKYESATDLFYVLSHNTCFFIICFPPEFLPASGLTEQWCSSTLGAALITPGYFTHFMLLLETPLSTTCQHFQASFLYLFHFSRAIIVSCFHSPSFFHVFTCHPILWLKGYHQGAASLTILIKMWSDDGIQGQ